MTDTIPGPTALRLSLSDQTDLLTGPPTPHGLAVRFRRVLTVGSEILDLLDEDDRDDEHPAAREIVARTLGWTAEQIGSYHRLPPGYGHGRLAAGGRSTLLAVVDGLDLLGLTLDHAYDAIHRGDHDELERQLAVVVHRFRYRSSAAHLVKPVEPVVDEGVALGVGDEIGADGIPRMPVPVPPAPPGPPAPRPPGASRPATHLGESR